MRKLHILDTSVLIDDPGAYKSYKNSDIIIPISVINELDKKKHHPGEAGKNARVCIRLLDQVSELGDINTGILLDDNILLKIDVQYNLVPPGFGDPTYADTDILAKAYYYYSDRSSEFDTTLVSNDLNLRLKAKARGIDACGHESKFSTSELYSGSCTITNEDAAIELQRNGFINPQDYSIDMHLHECVLFEDACSNGLAMGRKVCDTKIKLIKKIYPWNIKSRNKEQTFAMDLIFDRGIDLVTLIGKAGSGKTLVALGSALELVLDRKEYEKLIIYRPIQPVSNDIGFLPGPQPMDAKIATPDGWTTMGQLKIGDYVISKDGSPSKILGIFPKGKKDVFKITTTDGTSTECCEDHLWAVKSLYDRQINSDYRIISTKKMIGNLKSGGTYTYQLPRNDMVQFSKKELPIPPYSLGAYLGDGCSSDNHFTIYSADDEIIERVEKELSTFDIYMVKQKANKLSYRFYPKKQFGKDGARHVLASNVDGSTIEFDSISSAAKHFDMNTSYISGLCSGNKYSQKCGYSFVYLDKKMNSSHPIISKLKNMGLNSKRSWEKYIPDMYKYSSIEDRIALLRGLMDTDGTIKKNGECSFSTTSKQLAEDLIEIVRSLGGRANICIRDRVGKINKIGKLKAQHKRVSYEFTVSLPPHINPFYLRRKSIRFNSKNIAPIAIKTIENIGKKDVQCILIDHPEHLYLTDDFIVTHNTIEEKLAPWFQAIMDNFEHLFQTKNGDWHKGLEMYQRKGRIEMEALTYIRGRSIPNSIMLIDECFPHDQDIETNAGKKRIGILHKMWKSGKELPLVKTYNEKTDKFEYKKITHTWNRGEKSLVKITCSNREIKCTDNHKFLTKEGWVKARDLNIGDFIKTTEPKSHQILRDLNNDQLQLVIGSFLGDGSISNHGLNRYRLREVHGISQKEYCEWKGDILHAKQKIIKNNGYSQKPAIQIQTKMFGLSDYLPNNKSYCPNWLIDKLDAKAVAIWFMDDGSVNSGYNGAQLSTCSFDLQTQMKLVKKLNSMGIECKVSFCNMKGRRAPGYYYISFKKRGYEQLCSVISPYVHKSMIYKVQNATCDYNWNDNYHNYGLTVVDNIEFNVGNEVVYDIEVEDNHNFIVCSKSRKILGGLIAHNCQNISKEDMKTVLTRVGEGTKIILTGDIDQIDNSGLDAMNNGLSYVIEKFKDSNIAGHITFTQGERSRLATLAAEIL